MSEFLTQYLQLLIKQYFDKPNARAEVLARIEAWEKIYNFVVQWRTEFDLDTATGDRLDKIGKIVGLPRNVPNSLPRIRFGFQGSPSPNGFGTLSAPVFGAPFFSLNEELYTDYQLDDNDYRLFIRAKIAVNHGSGFLTSDDYVSLQDVVGTLFGGEGRVLDNYDMSLTLYIPYTIDKNRMTLFQRLNLLPKPQGVRYAAFIRSDADSFRLASGPDDTDPSGGFGTLSDNSIGGRFASFL